MGKWGLNVSVRPHFFCLLYRSFYLDLLGFEFIFLQINFQ